MSAPAHPSRSRRLILGLGVFAALSFAAGVLLAVLDPAEVAVPSHEADTFSRSAIGHRGLVRWLRALGVPVVVSRAGTAAKAGPGTVLAILEPPAKPDPGRLTRLVEAADPDVILVALPKWTGHAHRTRDGWIAELERVPDADRDAVLAALGVDARTAPAADGAWRSDGAAPPVVPALREPQGLTGDVDPLLTRGETVVIGLAWRDDTPLVIVADPDLLANAGLVHHAPLLADLLRPLLSDPARALVVDETLHGYVSTASLARQFFEFPLAAVTAQAGAVVLLAMLAGLRRFGAPVPAPPGLGRGRRVLVENTAALGHFAGHDADALRRYWQATLGRVSAGLHAPSALGPADTLAWLDRIGRGRGVDVDPAALAAQVDEAETLRPAARLALARRIHGWRRAILGERDAIEAIEAIDAHDSEHMPHANRPAAGRRS